MKKNVLPVFLAFALAAGGCGGDGSGDGAAGGQGVSQEAVAQTDSAMEDDYTILDGKLDSDISDIEKSGLVKAFLEKYPESSHTVGLAGALVWFQGHKGGDLPGAVDFVEKVRGRIEDDELGLDFDRRLIGWYGEAGSKEKMVEVASRLDGDGVARFGDYFTVIESAVAMEEWAMARAWCIKAGPKATAAAWRAEWPDEEATEEEMERAGSNRGAMLKLNDSWARANLGEIDEALEGFEEASGIVSANFIGVHGYGLDNYWGKTLMMKGDPENAIGKFAPGALIAHGEEETEWLKKAFTAINGTSSGYDAWAKRYRDSIAKPFEDFELPDPSGKRHRFTDLRGRVTMLNFWSPT